MTTTRCWFNTSKSGDELISMKETFGLCEGRAEEHYYILVRATCTTCVFGWQAVLWNVWKVVYGQRMQQSRLVDANIFPCLQLSGWLVTASLSVFVWWTRDRMMSF